MEALSKTVPFLRFCTLSHTVPALLASLAVVRGFHFRGRDIIAPQSETCLHPGRARGQIPQRCGQAGRISRTAQMLRLRRSPDSIFLCPRKVIRLGHPLGRNEQWGSIGGQLMILNPTQPPCREQDKIRGKFSWSLFLEVYIGDERVLSFPCVLSPLQRKSWCTHRGQSSPVGGARGAYTQLVRPRRPLRSSSVSHGL